MNGLSERQLIAIREYLKGRSEAMALRLAGYSESLAATKPAHVFGNPKVQAEIRKRQMENEKKNEVNVSWICQKMMEIVNAENVKDSDKLRALELLGKNKGMFTDKLEVTMKEDLVERLQRGRDRVAARKVELDEQAAHSDSGDLLERSDDID